MSDDTRKPFFVQRKQLGRIRMLNTQKKFGFIAAEDYREDVFFHFDQWEAVDSRATGPQIDQFVEFEIDELHRRAEGRLRAVSVRITKRPEGTKLEDSADPHLRAKHHPKARRSKPGWRKKPTAEE
jgi:cold shock CspA family protein